MRILSQPRRFPNHGYALMLTLGFIAISILVLASLARWSTTATTITARNNAFNSAVAAAEGATEVIIAQMNRDFSHQALNTNAGAYNSLMPGSLISNSWPADYEFSDGHGNKNQTDVLCTGWQQWTNVDSTFGGLYGMVNSYQITSNAKKLTGPYAVSAGVRQNIQLTSIPVFQFAIFYTMDLEINPSPAMIISGKTHSNGDIYTAPSTSLEYVDTVSAAGSIYNHRSTNDPTSAKAVAPSYDNGHYNKAGSLTMPVGVDNNPTNVVAILDVPPADESPSSPMGLQRYFNRTDLVIVTASNQVTVLFNNYEDGTSFQAVTNDKSGGSGSSGFSFINTNATFFDSREGKQVVATEIDIQALTNWMASSGGFSFNQSALARTGHQINTIYVMDQRSGSGKLPAVRVTNGQYLPASGLTVATPLPIYVKGNFNAPDLTVGQTNTSQTAPASLISDAVTILSSAWKDSNSADRSTSLPNRVAGNTTVNAALLAGIVPSVTVGGQGHYSGGVENFTRFLEDWGGSTFTYNGSMVVMFPSRYATSYWISPGTYYQAPKRDWAFDKNFLNMNKLPPATPQVKKLQRASWTTLAASNN
jgi:hypothetical protein